MLKADTTDDTVRKRAAVAELYESHYERVARYILVRIGDQAEAEDLASEVFCRALRAVDSYQHQGPPMEAWIFKIAHNIVVDHLRKRGRRPAAVPVDEAFSLASGDDPEGETERQEAIEEVRRAISQLSDAQQQVLALRFWGELTSEEVAATLKKKPGAVREMQSAAVRKLRGLLGSQLGT